MDSRFQLFFSRNFAAVAALFVFAVSVTSCGGGGLFGRTDSGRTPDIAGTWSLSETTTDDPSGNTPPGAVKTFDIVISQSGENFTVTAPGVPGAPTGTGTLDGGEFTFDAEYSFGSGRGTYAVSGWVYGTIEGAMLVGTGVIDIRLSGGTDDLGLDSVRISFDWQAAKQG